MESLQVESISQAQAKQRSGRAGRISAGFCFRMYTEESFESLDPETTPEILRVNLAQVVLQLKGMGVKDPNSFDFVTAPDTAGLARAIRVLYALEALDDKLELTDHGRRLAVLPLDPIFGNLLLQSEKYSCTKEILTAVSVLSAENIFYRPTAMSQNAAVAHRRFTSHEGDLSTFLRVYDAWQNEAVFFPPDRGGRKAERKILTGQMGKNRLSHDQWCRGNFIVARSMARAYHIRRQLESICVRPLAQNGLGMNTNLSCGVDVEMFFKCLAAGLFLQSASRVKAESSIDGRGKSGDLQQFQRGRYRTTMGSETVSIHPTSTLFGRNPAPACIVYTELVVTKKTYIRGVTQIREEWLQEVAPRFFKT
jgi:HrpA-like RNA helicase